MTRPIFDKNSTKLSLESCKKHCKIVVQKSSEPSLDETMFDKSQKVAFSPGLDNDCHLLNTTMYADNYSNFILNYIYSVSLSKSHIRTKISLE